MNYINSTLYLINLEFWKRATYPTLHDCATRRDGDGRAYGHDRGRDYDRRDGDDAHHRHDREALH